MSRDKSSSILYRLFQSLCISETLSMISTFQRFHNCVGQYHKCRLNWKTNRADGSPILVCINIIRFFPTQPRMPPRLRDHIANNHSYPPSSSSSSPSAAATILIIAFIVDYLSVQWPALTFSLRHVKSTIFHTFITMSITTMIHRTQQRTNCLPPNSPIWYKRRREPPSSATVIHIILNSNSAIDRRATTTLNK